MKGRGLLLVFAVGCIILFAAFVIGYANEEVGDFASQIGIMQILTGALGVVVLVLAAMSILNVGKARWTALTWCAILLLGFSVLTFSSVGRLIAPAALIILVFSIMSILNVGKARWTALTLCAILLLGFSVFFFFSVGWLIAPAALIILVFSIWKLRACIKSRHSRENGNPR